MGWHVSKARAGRYGDVREGQPAVAVILVEQVRLTNSTNAVDTDKLDLSLVTTMYLGDKWEYLFRFPGEQSASQPTLRAYGQTPLEAVPHSLTLPAQHVWVYPAA